MDGGEKADQEEVASPPAADPSGSSEKATKPEVSRARRGSRLRNLEDMGMLKVKDKDSKEDSGPSPQEIKRLEKEERKKAKKALKARDAMVEEMVVPEDFTMAERMEFSKTKSPEEVQDLMERYNKRKESKPVTKEDKRRMIKKRLDAVRLLQRCWRGHVVRKGIVQPLLEARQRHRAILKIQKVARGLQSRTKMKGLRIMYKENKLALDAIDVELQQTKFRREWKADYGGNTRIHIAAEEDLYKCVEFYITIGADPNKRDCCGRTVLDHALNHESYQVVAYLLSVPNCNVDAIWSRTTKPDFQKVIYYLKEHQAPRNALVRKNSFGHTLAHAAARRGSVISLNFLYDRKLAQFTSEGCNRGVQPLSVALNFGHLEAAALILTRTSEIKETDLKILSTNNFHQFLFELKDQVFPFSNIKQRYVCSLLLYHAVNNKLEEDIVFLLQEGVKAACVFPDLRSPLSIYVKTGRPSLAKKLIRAGTPIDGATKEIKEEWSNINGYLLPRLDIDEELKLKYGTFKDDIVSTGEKSLTPLYIAYENLRSEVVAALIEEGADLEPLIMFSDGFVLDEAVDYLAKTGYFLSLEAKVEGEDEHLKWHCKSPEMIHVAARLGALRTLQFLTSRGCSLNKLWNDMSPMHIACKYQQEAAIYQLLDYGANILMKNGVGKIPFDLANPGIRLCIKQYYSLKKQMLIDQLNDGTQSISEEDVNTSLQKLSQGKHISAIITELFGESSGIENIEKIRALSRAPSPIISYEPSAQPEEGEGGQKSFFIDPEILMEAQKMLLGDAPGMTLIRFGMDDPVDEPEGEKPQMRARSSTDQLPSQPSPESIDGGESAMGFLSRAIRECKQEGDEDLSDLMESDEEQEQAEVGAKPEDAGDLEPEGEPQSDHQDPDETEKVQGTTEAMTSEEETDSDVSDSDFTEEDVEEIESDSDREPDVTEWGKYAEIKDLAKRKAMQRADLEKQMVTLVASLDQSTKFTFQNVEERIVYRRPSIYDTHTPSIVKRAMHKNMRLAAGREIKRRYKEKMEPKEKLYRMPVKSQRRRPYCLDGIDPNIYTVVHEEVKKLSDAEASSNSDASD